MAFNFFGGRAMQPVDPVENYLEDMINDAEEKFQKTEKDKASSLGEDYGKKERNQRLAKIVAGVGGVAIGSIGAAAAIGSIIQASEKK